MIGYVTIGVSDMERAKDFYRSCSATWGLPFSWTWSA